MVDHAAHAVGAGAECGRELRALVVVDEAHARARVRREQLADRRGARQPPVRECERGLSIQLAGDGGRAGEEAGGTDGRGNRVKVGRGVPDEERAE